MNEKLMETLKDVSKERAIEITLEEGEKTKHKAWQQGVGNGVAAGFVLGLGVAFLLNWAF